MRVQKQMLGERLYPTIQKLEPRQPAGKITGMLLELSKTEILLLLENRAALVARVKEAVTVLEDHWQSCRQGVCNTCNLSPKPRAQPAVDGAAAVDVEEKISLVYDLTRLMSAIPEEQKQILRKWIFPKIRELQSAQAFQITDMLLELDHAEIICCLEDQVALVAKVKEAVEVLKTSQQG